MSFLNCGLEQSLESIVLITVSGMVGSGKTTTVREIASFGKALGLEAHTRRFQSLPCITLRPQRRVRRGSPRTTGGPRHQEAPTTRWAGYTRKRLCITAVALFVVRILAFRVYQRTVWNPDEWNVLNRYFYDSLSHYQPASSLERMYYRAILAMIPRPDVAILVTAGLETIAARRPAYAKEYIELVGESYRHLAAKIDDLIELSTDEDATRERLSAILQTRLR